MTGYQSKKDMAQDKLAQPEQEPVAIVHIKDGCLVGSHRDESKPFPDGQYGLWPITTPPQRQWVGSGDLEDSNAYQTPPAAQRTWVSLTDDQIKEIVGPWGDTPIKGYTRKLIDQIEAKLRENNNG